VNISAVVSSDTSLRTGTLTNQWVREFGHFQTDAYMKIFEKKLKIAIFEICSFNRYFCMLSQEND
jgi:hypothetical protein